MVDELFINQRNKRLYILNVTIYKQQILLETVQRYLPVADLLHLSPAKRKQKDPNKHNTPLTSSLASSKLQLGFLKFIPIWNPLQVASEWTYMAQSILNEPSVDVKKGYFLNSIKLKWNLEILVLYVGGPLLKGHVAQIPLHLASISLNYLIQNNTVNEPKWSQ